MKGHPWCFSLAVDQNDFLMVCFRLWDVAAAWRYMCFYTRYVICDGFSDGEKLIIPIWIEGLGSNLCCLLPSDLLSSVLWPITLRVFVVAKIGVFVHILLFVLILGKLENLVVNQPSSVTLSRRCRTRTKNGWIGKNGEKAIPDIGNFLGFKSLENDVLRLEIGKTHQNSKICKRNSF